MLGPASEEDFVSAASGERNIQALRQMEFVGWIDSEESFRSEELWSAIWNLPILMELDARPNARNLHANSQSLPRATH
jgi:hypothetical protein